MSAITKLGQETNILPAGLSAIVQSSDAGVRIFDQNGEQVELTADLQFASAPYYIPSAGSIPNISAAGLRDGTYFVANYDQGTVQAWEPHYDLVWDSSGQAGRAADASIVGFADGSYTVAYTLVTPETRPLGITGPFTSTGVKSSELWAANYGSSGVLLRQDDLGPTYRFVSFGSGGATGSGAGDPQLALLGQSGAAAAWNGPDGVMLKTMQGGTWGATVQLSAEGGSVGGISALASGDFIVTWTDSSSSHILFQKFRPDGVAVSDPKIANQISTGLVSASKVSAVDATHFAVTWVDNSHAMPADSAQSPDADGTAVKVRVFNLDGSAATDETLVNTTTAGDQTGPQIVQLRSGDFAVAWTDGSGSGPLTKAQEFTANPLQLSFVNASTAKTGEDGDSNVEPGSISGDGRFVAFQDLLRTSLRTTMILQKAMGLEFS